MLDGSLNTSPGPHIRVLRLLITAVDNLYTKIFFARSWTKFGLPALHVRA